MLPLCGVQVPLWVYFADAGVFLLVLIGFGVTTDIHDQKEMQQKLQEADRRKDEFLATLAHELRNPLAPIRNALHILRLGPDKDEESAEGEHEKAQRLEGAQDATAERGAGSGTRRKRRHERAF